MVTSDSQLLTALSAKEKCYLIMSALEFFAFRTRRRLEVASFLKYTLTRKKHAHMLTRALTRPINESHDCIEQGSRFRKH